MLRVESAAPVKATLECDPLAAQLEVDGLPIPLIDEPGRLARTAVVTLPAGRSELRLATPGAFVDDVGAQGRDLVPPPLVTRHPLLHAYPGPKGQALLTLRSVALLRRWGRVDATRLVLRLPPGWRLTPFGDGTPLPPPCSGPGAAPGPGGCWEAAQDGTRVITWTWSRDDAGRRAREARATRTGATFFDGGPLAGLGWGGGGGCLGCWQALTVRLGWEVGVSSWGLLALVGEFSPDDRWAVVPSLDFAMLPNVRWIPAVTLGLGTPVRVAPDAELGFRLQLSTSWPVAPFSVGLLGIFDAYAEGSTLGRIVLQLGL